MKYQNEPNEPMERDYRKIKKRFLRDLKELNKNIVLLTLSEAKTIMAYNQNEEIILPKECDVLKTELIHEKILQIKYNKEEFVVFCQTKE